MGSSWGQAVQGLDWVLIASVPDLCILVTFNLIPPSRFCHFLVLNPLRNFKLPEYKAHNLSQTELFSMSFSFISLVVKVAPVVGKLSRVIYFGPYQVLKVNYLKLIGDIFNVQNIMLYHLQAAQCTLVQNIYF